ncbi:sensor histidine kinase [Flagellimonas sp. 2504JD4-2]
MEGKEIPFQVFITQDSELSLKDIVGQGNNFEKSEQLNQKTTPYNTYWIRLDLKDELKNLNLEPTWYLTYSSFDYATLFYEKNKIILEKPIGKYDPNTYGKRIKARKYFSEIPFDQNMLIQGRYLYIKAQRVMYFDEPINWSFSYQQESIENYYSWDNIKTYIPTYLFIGGSAIMAILTLLLFIYLRRWEFLFNSLYVLSLLFYLGKDELLLFFNFGTDNALLKDWAMENIAITTGLFYQGFFYFYLNLKRDYIFSYRVVQISFSLHVLMLFADTIFFQTSAYLSHIYLLESLHIIDAITAFVILVNLIYYNKNVITTFFIIGSTIFMIGVVHYFFTQDSSDPLRHYNKLFVTITCSLEILIFSFGLGYKVYTEIIEKFRLQKEAFIYKSQALRAQINPHFIFNALSSIQHLILQKKSSKALTYLTKFGRLSRNVLESSVETSSTLDEELKMLEDYLELEVLRFDSAFSYEFKIDDKLNPVDIEIPFMITQPFVENAIIHGLLPKKDNDKKLLIHFKMEPGYLVCEVDDNGVGRQLAEQRLHIYQKERKSRGLEVTKLRLESLGENQNSLQIIDKFDENNNPTGTKVIIRIPI